MLQVNRQSDRIMRIQLVIAEKKTNIISVYGPQVGCADDEKLKCWEELDEVRGREREIENSKTYWHSSQKSTEDDISTTG